MMSNQWVRELASEIQGHQADVVPTKPRFVKSGRGDGTGQLVYNFERRLIHFFEGDLGDFQRAVGIAYLPASVGLVLENGKHQEGLDMEIRQMPHSDQWMVYDVKPTGTDGRFPAEQRIDKGAQPTLSQIDVMRVKSAGGLSFEVTEPFRYIQPSTGLEKIAHDRVGSVGAAVALLTSGQHQPGLLYFDEETGKMNVVTGAAISAAGVLPSRNEFQDYDYLAIVKPPHSRAVSNVYLYYGQTTLDELDYRRKDDPRILFTASLRHRYGATAAPTTGDDSDDGYGVGSVWIDTTTDKAYICVDSTPAAAVWYETGGGGASSPLTTKGDVYTYSTADDRLPVGGDGEVLTADSGEPTGLKWTAPAGSVTIGSYASLPAAGSAGRLYFATDGVYNPLVDDGGEWLHYHKSMRMIPPDNSVFSWINQSGATITTTQGGVFLRVPTTGGVSTHIRKMTAPATPYTVTLFVLPQLVSAAFSMCGFCWRQSSDGKLIVFELIYSGGWLFGVEKQDSPSTGGVAYVGLAAAPHSGGVWLRATDDGTNRICSWSTDGIEFTQIHSVGRTDYMTADEIGFVVASNNSTYEAGARFLSWEVT